MIKKIFIVMSFLLLIVIQAVDAGSLKEKEKKSILNTTTIFLLDGGAAYNKALQAEVPKAWKVTPFKFATVKEAQAYLNDDKYSFVFRVTFIQISNLKPDEFEDLAAYGPMTSFSKIKRDDMVESDPLNFADDKKMLDKLPNYIERLDYCCNGGIPYYMGIKWSEVNAHAGEAKSKTLYILKSQMGDDAARFKEKATKLYPYKITYVDDKALKTAIYAYDTSICYIMTYNGSQCLINAGTGLILILSGGSTAHPHFDTYHLREFARSIEKEK